MKKKILILTSDPESINGEIIKKSLFFFKKKLNNDYIFIGDLKQTFGNLKTNEYKIKLINISKNCSKKIYMKKCFQKAFILLKTKEAQGLINLPLNKKNLPKKYSGFTEYISNYFNTKGHETMLLYSRNFSVCPNTIHIPLNQVHLKLKEENIIKNIININNFYKKIIGINKPYIAIMGLNPHNGIDFYKKTEEEKIIIPAIKKLKKLNFKICGPISPDSAFNIIKQKKINVLVGNYHDQVLPLFKYINKFKGINITLGLPFLRVSPDHGTGKDIVGKNIANPESFLYALNFFEKYYKNT